MAMRQAQAVIELQESEAVIVHAASRIFAAFIRSGRLTAGNEAGLVRSSVQLAQQLAREADRSTRSDGEAAGAGGGGDSDILDLLEE